MESGEKGGGVVLVQRFHSSEDVSGLGSSVSEKSALREGKGLKRLLWQRNQSEDALVWSLPACFRTLCRFRCIELPQPGCRAKMPECANSAPHHTNNHGRKCRQKNYVHRDIVISG